MTLPISGAIQFSDINTELENFSKFAYYYIRKIGTVSVLATGYFQMP